MELRQLQVNSNDPFFTAEKWNNSLEYSINFENIISAILGKKFKGIYKPHLDYEINDYVWHDGKAYIVEGHVNQKFATTQLEGTSNHYFRKDGYLCILNEKLSLVSNNSNKTICETKIENFAYLDGNDFVIANKGTEVFKIFLNGKVEKMNFSFSNNIKKIFLDDFMIYALTDRKSIIVAEQNDGSLTAFAEYNLATNGDIIDTIVLDKYFLALNSNSEIIFYDKNNGSRVSINIIKSYVDKVDKSKLCSSDNHSVSVYTGQDKIVTFSIEGTNTKYSSTFTGAPLSIGVNSLNYSHGHFSVGNDSVVSSYIATKYVLKEVNLRTLINTASTISIKDADLSIDFSKGSVHSVSKGVVRPIGLSNDASDISNGIYSDGTTLYEIVNGKGIRINGNTKLSYPNNSFVQKTLILDLDNYETSNEDNCLGFISFNSNYGVELKPTLSTKTKPFKSFITLSGTPSSLTCSVEVYQNGYLVEAFTIVPKQLAESNVLKLEAKNVTEGLLSKLIIIDKIDKYTTDILSYCSISVPVGSYDTCSPNSVVKSNGNGAVYLRSSDGSLVNEANGIKVNSSSSYNANSPWIMFTTSGAKTLHDELLQLKNKVEGEFSQANHEHHFAEILNTPTGTVNQKGIVQLSSNYNATSNDLAATIGSVNQVFKIANHSHPYSLNSHSHNFSEIGSVPSATTGQKGIVQLSSDFSGGISGSLAATISSVNSVYRIASHGHPYLNISGGTLNGNLRVNGGHFDLAKNNGHSWIRFDAQSNDNGYILHYENNNSSTMRFVVSDDVATNDSFQWGSTPGGANDNAMNLTTTGNLWTKGSLDSSYIHSRGDLYVAGNANFNDLFIRSDKRIKYNIEKIEDGLSKVEKLSGYTYNLKRDNTTSAGLIAQELQEVLPNAVKENEDGVLTIQYHSVIALLLEAVKELSDEVKRIKKEA